MRAETLKIIRTVLREELDKLAIPDDDREEFDHIMRFATNDIHTYGIVKHRIYCKGGCNGKDSKCNRALRRRNNTNTP